MEGVGVGLSSLNKRAVVGHLVCSWCLLPENAQKEHPAIVYEIWVGFWMTTVSDPKATEMGEKWKHYN
jgi:hypothetical protein